MGLSLSLPPLVSYFCLELAVLRSARLSCQLDFVVGEWKQHSEGICVAQELRSGHSWLQNEKGKHAIIHRDPPAGLFVYTVEGPYLFSAVIATLKSLTDKGTQRLRIVPLWVVVLLPPPPGAAAWELLGAVEVEIDWEFA